MEVFVVVKETPIAGSKQSLPLTFNTNEAVFSTEDAARQYVTRRKALKDCDDRRSELKIQPWYVQEI